VNSYSYSVIFCLNEQLSTLRELSIMSPKSPPVSMRFIPEQNDKGALTEDTHGFSDLLSQQPSRYFLPPNNVT
jgi:RAB6A-GEF complex partner protein 1